MGKGRKKHELYNLRLGKCGKMFMFVVDMGLTIVYDAPPLWEIGKRKTFRF